MPIERENGRQVSIWYPPDRKGLILWHFKYYKICVKKLRVFKWKGKIFIFTTSKNFNQNDWLILKFTKSLNHLVGTDNSDHQIFLLGLFCRSNLQSNTNKLLQISPFYSTTLYFQVSVDISIILPWVAQNLWSINALELTF